MYIMYRCLNEFVVYRVFQEVEVKLKEYVVSTHQTSKRVLISMSPNIISFGIIRRFQL